LNRQKNPQLWCKFKLRNFGKDECCRSESDVRGDLRFITKEQKEAARARIREIVAKSLPGAAAKITLSLVLTSQIKKS